MFQDEKTIELDLRSPASRDTSSGLRWTEHTRSRPQVSAPQQTTKAVVLDEKHVPWLIKLAAAVTILILSTWLF